MSRSSSRIPCASINSITAGNGPPRSGWQMKVSIAPAVVAMSRVLSIIAIPHRLTARGVADKGSDALGFQVHFYRSRNDIRPQEGLMTRMTGGGALVEMLCRHGVDTLFALPGVQNDALFVALYDAGEKLRVIHPRHEQAAAYMAFGYARASGRPGAFAVVPGPGLLNTTAALATAYATNTPVLCISGQIPSDLIGRGFGLLHEIPDQLAILKGLTKWATRPSER